MINPRLLVIQHNWDDSLNDLGGPLVEAGLHLDTWCTFQADEPPEPLTSFDGVLSLGGTDSVADEPTVDWIGTELRLTEAALASGTPVLGICFGAQMLARAVGATVVPAPAAEIGWQEVAMEPPSSRDTLFSIYPDRFHAFQFHYDTFTDPPGAAVFGRGNDMVQAFRVGDNAWGVQFHAEASPALIHAWMASYRASMRDAGVDFDQVRQLTAAHWLDYRRLGEALAAAFAAEVTERALAQRG